MAAVTAVLAHQSFVGLVFGGAVSFDGFAVGVVVSEGHVKSAPATSGFLELDHIVPFAVGGEATVENLRLLCKSHSHEADLRFGPRGRDGRGGLVREELATCRNRNSFKTSCRRAAQPP
ncbi:MAG: hypothetical protein DMG07_17185 [Acidobacteria bacterium]|nr:MAG: hypothetical protein DMG07_17185 [Acidobacteriota bacterium]